MDFYFNNVLFVYVIIIILSPVEFGKRQEINLFLQFVRPFKENVLIRKITILKQKSIAKVKKTLTWIGFIIFV